VDGNERAPAVLILLLVSLGRAEQFSVGERYTVTRRI
jgi:hypothetical protein